MTDKLTQWEPHTRAQGGIILPVCIEDGGYLSEGGHELIDLACKALGGTKGEVSAFYTYWRQRLAITNLRGVAKTILQRTPYCTGTHFPVTPHHFGSQLDRSQAQQDIHIPSSSKTETTTTATMTTT